MNVNNITNNTSELFIWPQPTTSFNVNESQLVDNTPVNKKKSTPHVSTYPLTQVTQHVDNFSPNSSQTTNSTIVLTQENMMPPDKDGKRFKCRKKLFLIFSNNLFLLTVFTVATPPVEVIQDRCVLSFLSADIIVEERFLEIVKGLFRF